MSDTVDKPNEACHRGHNAGVRDSAVSMVLLPSVQQSVSE